MDLTHGCARRRHALLSQKIPPRARAPPPVPQATRREDLHVRVGCGGALSRRHPPSRCCPWRRSTRTSPARTCPGTPLSWPWSARAASPARPARSRPCPST
eukprot:3465929-Prymnesium_polylepis.1